MKNKNVVVKKVVEQDKENVNMYCKHIYCIIIIFFILYCSAIQR